MAHLSNSLFDDPEIAALVAETKIAEEKITLPGEAMATREQIQYIKDLLEITNGYEGDYDFKTLTLREASEIIDELKDEAESIRGY